MSTLFDDPDHETFVPPPPPVAYRPPCTGGCGGVCHKHPSPDKLGRTPCDRCGCFSARIVWVNRRPVARHSWC